MRKIRPIFIENSRLPIWLSKVAPIDIWAFNFGPLVFCRGTLNEKTKVHETIHFFQQLEMLFVFQWLFYAIFYLIGRITKGSWKLGYCHNPFEQEAYDNDQNPDYLNTRRWWGWLKYTSQMF
jgi:hypothetical protein